MCVAVVDIWHLTSGMLCSLDQYSTYTYIHIQMHVHTHVRTLLCSVLFALLSVVDEDALRKELKDFLKDSKSQVKPFPPSLSSEHRKIIHEVRIASILPVLLLLLILILFLYCSAMFKLSRPPSLYLPFARLSCASSSA